MEVPGDTITEKPKGLKISASFHFPLPADYGAVEAF